MYNETGGLVNSTVMRNTNITLGKSHDFYWLVSRNEIPDIDKLIIKCHGNHILHLVTFDSGPLVPNEQELTEGWATDGEIMISPPLDGNVDIPHEQYDEWHLSKTKLSIPGRFDRFVNYRGFNLSPESEFNPEILAQFWRQLETTILWFQRMKCSLSASVKAYNKALVRTQTTLRLVCAAQLQR